MSDSTKVMAEKHTILRTVVGSTVHGLNVNDGIEDRDEMGVCIEDPEYVVGLRNFEQYIYRSAEEREGKNARSSAGDLDLVIYSLRKYVRLALKGNPTILALLFVPFDFIVFHDSRGTQLQDLAPLIVSRSAGGAFLGYLNAQRARIVGEKGQKRCHRPELEEMYGFDTKYACHMLRLGFQGVELLQTGRLTLPMNEPERTWLRSVRKGEVELQECLTKAGLLADEIKDLIHDGPLQDKPDTYAVEKWMMDVYLQSWEARKIGG